MRVTELRAHSIAAERIPVEMTNGEEVWQMTFVDKESSDVIFIRFGREVRDAILGQFHGGVVLAAAPDLPA